MPASSLRATGLVLPLWVNVPFGSKVDQVTAELDLSETAERSTPVRIIELAWGVLRLSGSGTIGFDDETRLAGRLDVSIDDPLAILDAVQLMLSVWGTALMNSPVVRSSVMTKPERAQFDMTLLPLPLLLPSIQTYESEMQDCQNFHLWLSDHRFFGPHEDQQEW